MEKIVAFKEDNSMNQDRLLEEAAARTGVSLEEAEGFYQVLVDILAESMGQGESVECMPAFGKFIPKLRDNVGLNEESPRSRKKPHYFIQFKPSKKFEQMLLLQTERTAD